jgi:hypothetical protein
MEFVLIFQREGQSTRLLYAGKELWVETCGQTLFGGKLKKFVESA